jgi:hypothetical protein
LSASKLQRRGTAMAIGRSTTTYYAACGYVDMLRALACPRHLRAPAGRSRRKVIIPRPGRRAELHDGSAGSSRARSGRRDKTQLPHRGRRSMCQLDPYVRRARRPVLALPCLPASSSRLHRQTLLPGRRTVPTPANEEQPMRKSRDVLLLVLTSLHSN